MRKLFPEQVRNSERPTPFNPPPVEGGKTNQNISFLRIKTEGWYSKNPSFNLMRKSQSGTKPFLGQNLFSFFQEKVCLSRQHPFPPSWDCLRAECFSRLGNERRWAIWTQYIYTEDVRGWVAQTQHYSRSTTKNKELCLCQ